MAKPKMQDQIDELERTLRCEQEGYRICQAELAQIKKRLSEIAAENESLRMDKKWLQQMHSAVLQSMHEFVRGRNH
jgi:regulator of replication initiation timing